MKTLLAEMKKKNLTTYVMLIIAYIIVEILILTGLLSYQLQGILVPVCTYVIMAISLNLVVGILGELSLGHAGFMCVGAFLGGSFSICMEQVIPNGFIRLLLALVVGAVCAGIIGFLIGMPVLRLNGDYLAIVTLAFGEIIKNLVNLVYLGYDSKGIHFSMKDMASLNLEENGVVVIKGAQGVTGMPTVANFTVGIVLILFSVFIIMNLVNSRDGRAIKSIRDNQIAAQSVGINITKYKLMAFTISAALAGMAGAFYAHNFSNIKATTNNFGYNMSIMILVFVVLGGIGNIKGSIIAATILTLLPEVLRFMSQYRMLVYAIVLIVMMIFNWSPKARLFKERIIAKCKTFLVSKMKKSNLFTKAFNLKKEEK